MFVKAPSSLSPVSSSDGGDGGAITRHVFVSQANDGESATEETKGGGGGVAFSEFLESKVKSLATMAMTDETTTNSLCKREMAKTRR